MANGLALPAFGTGGPVRANPFPEVPLPEIDIEAVLAALAQVAGGVPGAEEAGGAALPRGQDINSIISQLTQLVGQGSRGLGQAEDDRIAAARDRRARLDAGVSEAVSSVSDATSGAVNSTVKAVLDAIIDAKGTPLAQGADPTGTDIPISGISEFFNSIQGFFNRPEALPSPLQEGPSGVLPPPEAPVVPEIADSPAQFSRPASGPIFLGDAVPGRGELNLGDVPRKGRTARDAAQEEIERLLKSLSGEDDDRTPPTFLEKLKPILGGAAAGAAGANAVGSGGVARVLAGAGAGAAGAARVAKKDEKEFQAALDKQKKSVELLRLNLKLRDSGERDTEEFEYNKAQHEQDSIEATFKAQRLQGEGPETQLSNTGVWVSQKTEDGRTKFEHIPIPEVEYQFLIGQRADLAKRGASASGKGLRLNPEGDYKNDPEGRDKIETGRSLITDSAFSPVLGQLAEGKLQARLGSDVFTTLKETDPEAFADLLKDESFSLTQFLISIVDKFKRQPEAAGMSKDSLIEAALLQELKRQQQGQ